MELSFTFILLDWSSQGYMDLFILKQLQSKIIGSNGHAVNDFSDMACKAKLYIYLHRIIPIKSYLISPLVARRQFLCRYACLFCKK